ncbi:hypothetical protein ACA910_003888 [Epithemia clementina (nom. ined.)]
MSAFYYCKRVLLISLVVLDVAYLTVGFTPWFASFHSSSPTPKTNSDKTNNFSQQQPRPQPPSSFSNGMRLLASTFSPKSKGSISKNDEEPHPPGTPPPEKMFKTSNQNGSKKATDLLNNAFFLSKPTNKEKVQAADWVEWSFSSMEGGLEEDELRYVRKGSSIPRPSGSTAVEKSNREDSHEETKAKREADRMIDPARAVSSILDGRIETEVSESAIKGALLMGALSAAITGQGVAMTGAASIGAAYIALTTGPVGEAIRTAGNLVWDVSTGAIEFYKQAELSAAAYSSRLKEERAIKQKRRMFKAKQRTERNQRNLLAAQLQIELKERQRRAEKRLEEVQRLAEENKRLDQEAAELEARLVEIERLKERTRKAEERRRREHEEAERAAEEFRKSEALRRARLLDKARQRAAEDARMAREAKEARLAKQAEEEKLAEAARLAEAVRQAEEERKKQQQLAAERAEAERRRKEEEEEQERLAQLAEEEEHARLEEMMRQEEEEAERLAEIARQVEKVRLAEIARREEETRLAEIERKEKEEEAARLAEVARKKQEALMAETARKEEEARLAEIARKEEENRLAEVARKEVARKEVARKEEEERRLAEIARAKAEEERLAEEARQEESARAKAEEERLAEEARQEEMARAKAEEERHLAETKQKEEERMAAKLEEERLAEKARKNEKERLAKIARLKEEDEKLQRQIEEAARIAAEMEEGDAEDMDEEDWEDMDEEDWEASIRSAQQSIDGNLVGQSRFAVDDDKEKMAWKSATEVAAALGVFEDDVDEEEEELERERMAAAARAAVEAFQSKRGSDADSDGEIYDEGTFYGTLPGKTDNAALEGGTFVDDDGYEYEYVWEEIDEEEEEKYASQFEEEDFVANGDGRSVYDDQNSKKDWSKYPISVLKAELKERGFSPVGKKADLVAILKEDDRLFDKKDFLEKGDVDKESAAYAGINDFSLDDILSDNDEPTSEELARIEEGGSLLDFESMTVPELKEELRARGLKLGGKKAELVARLEAHVSKVQTD